MFPEAGLTIPDTNMTVTKPTIAMATAIETATITITRSWTGVMINAQARERGCSTDAGEVLASSPTTMHALALGNGTSSW